MLDFFRKSTIKSGRLSHSRFSNPIRDAIALIELSYHRSTQSTGIRQENDCFGNRRNKLLSSPLSMLSTFVGTIDVQMKSNVAKWMIINFEQRKLCPSTISVGHFITDSASTTDSDNCSSSSDEISKLQLASLFQSKHWNVWISFICRKKIYCIAFLT